MDVQAKLNPSDLFSAQGLVVVITGGGSGIGLAIASALYQNGASKIYLLGRRENVLEEAIKTLQSASSAPRDRSNILVAQPCDVIDQSSVSTVVSRITKEIGYVDVLINNAGVLGPTNGVDLYKADSIEEVKNAMLMDFDKWDTAMAINIQSIVGVSAAFLPLLEAANVRRGWATGKVTGSGKPRVRDTTVSTTTPDDDRMAHIINVGSVASFSRYVTAGIAYSASKSAAAQLSKIMSSFLGGWGIRSNVICPGPYPSEMTKTVGTNFGTNEVPQGRMGNVNDIASLALFLVGKGGAYINGTVQLTDGGRVGVFPATY